MSKGEALFNKIAAAGDTPGAVRWLLAGELVDLSEWLRSLGPPTDYRGVVAYQVTCEMAARYGRTIKGEHATP